MPVKFWQKIVRFWFFLSYLITTVHAVLDPSLELTQSSISTRSFGKWRFELTHALAWLQYNEYMSIWVV